MRGDCIKHLCGCKTYTRSKEIAEQNIEMRVEIGTVKIESWINVKKVILATLANEIKIKQSYNNMEELQRYLTKQHKGKEDILAMYLSKVDSEYIKI